MPATKINIKGLGLAEKITVLFEPSLALFQRNMTRSNPHSEIE
jgi:hypothetical protein